jgi:hypothetical protein
MQKLKSTFWGMICHFPASQHMVIGQQCTWMFKSYSIHFIINWRIHLQNIINVCISPPFIINVTLFPCTIIYIWPCCNLKELFHIFPPLHKKNVFRNVVKTCRSALVFNISSYSFYFLLLFQHRNVQLDTQVLLCLWHVRKAWAKNIVKKIVNPQERSNVLSMFGRIMYSWGCPIDANPIFRVEQKFEML